MKITLFIIILICASTKLEHLDNFIHYGFQFNKGYEKLEYNDFIEKYKTFVLNYENIEQHNKYSNYKIGLTPFTDIPLAELKEKYLSDFSNYLNPNPLRISYPITPNYTPIDWRNANILLPVRDQKDCGGCWAFSTTGTAEAIRAISSGYKAYLSPQQLIDCDSKEKGCKGGWPSIAFSYMKRVGVVEDSLYPYMAENKTCNTEVIESSTVFKTSSLISCEEEECNQNDFIYNMLKNGPVSVVIDAYHFNFFNYKSGYYDEECSEPNHAIILVGFGYDMERDIQYWIIRNSWGDKWGMNGYGYVKVNEKNNWSCNVTKYGFQPKF
jgi:C1A family cysteine protease